MADDQRLRQLQLINQRRQRQIEAIEIIMGCLTQEGFTYEGKHFQVPYGVTLRPRPIQQPHIRVALATGGTPAPVVEKLSSSLIRITKIPEVVAELESQASSPVGSTPVQFRAFVVDEINRWKKVVEASGIQLTQ